MLERVWRTYQYVFRAIASSILVDKSLVDDALQEAFAKVLRAEKTFASDVQAFRFVRKAVHNASLDQLRRLTRRNRRFPSYDDPQVGEDSRPVDPESPLLLLVREEENRHHRDLLRELKSGLGQLNRDQRQAIGLMFGRNGRPIKKTCARLGVPYSTVRSRMLAGIDALRRHLAARGILEAGNEGGDP